MYVYKDILEISRIREIIDRFDDYPIFKSGKLMEDEEGPYLWLEFYEGIPVYYDGERFIKIDVWKIREGYKFEFYPDVPKLIVEL